MGIHHIFDALAYSSGFVVAFAYRRIFFHAGSPVPRELRIWYSAWLVHGVVIGSLFFGTLQLVAGDAHGLLGKSVLGALFGGIASVEVFKWLHRITGSTGYLYVPGIAFGIAVGRIGCFLTGLSDNTYGVATALPWGVDFGDGVLRHPVQLYESAAMILFFLVYSCSLLRGSSWVREKGFYLFVLLYAGQRFLWEFLKPYASVAGPFNVFHLLCMALALYALLMMSLARRTAIGASGTRVAH